MATLSEEQKRILAEQGFLILPGLLPAPVVDQLIDRLEALWAEEGERAGQENSTVVDPNTRRLANLANKGDLFRTLYAHPQVLAVVAAVLGPNMRLSMLNAREVPPQVAGAKQAFHADTDNSGKPDRKGFYSCTAIWMLDPFTAENGATRIVPGSHLSGQVPREAMADPAADHPEAVVMVGNPGDVAVFNGHCWHAGGFNLTDKPRRAILAHYLRADIPRPADRRQHISPEVRARLSPQELELLGIGEKQYLARAKIAGKNVMKSLKTNLPILCFTPLTTL